MDFKFNLLLRARKVFPFLFGLLLVSFSVSASSVDSISCHNGNNGAIQSTLTAGLLPWSYSWSNGMSGANISGLSAGTYTVTVTGLLGASATESFTLLNPPAIIASNSKVDLVCNGVNTGSIDLTVSGGNPPYTYTWSHGATTQDVSNLYAGNYTVTVRDGNNCSVTSSATITQPSAISISHTKTDVSCNNAGDGAIDITVSGAAAPYTYNWSNGATTQDIGSLAGGTYTVTVTDNAGCTASQSVFVVNPLVLSGSTTDTDVTCFGLNNGTIDLTVSGGTIPYSYSWSNGSTAQDISSLAPGTYHVTITDVKGCTASNTGIVITQPLAALSRTITKVDILCNGANTGSVDLTVSGGTTPYNFVWSNGATTEDLNNIVAGTYNVTITDANGCTVSGGTTITQPAALNSSIVRTNVTCLGASDGTINLTVSGGVLPYIFSWSNGAVSEDLSGLAPGTYSVTVTDNNGCTTTRSSTVTQPSALSTSHTQVNASCSGSGNGSINLSVAGGTPGYSYIWTNGATTQDISSLVAGTYTVTVTDDNGCTVSHSATITQPGVLGLSVVKTDVLCNGGNNGAIDLTVTGGTVPYFYSWSNGSNNQDLVNRTAGTYTVTVTDLLGCTASISTTITQPSVLSASNTRTNITCNAASNGSVNLTVTGGVAPYSFLWSNGATTEDISGLASGSYSATVTDANGCTRISSATITQPTALTTSNTRVNVYCFGGSNGSINLSVAGGTSPYSYLWSNGATTQDINSLVANDYTVTVTDANSCTATRTVSITQPTELALSTTKVDVLCSGYNTGSINLTVSGGVSPYSYVWSNGATSQDLVNRYAGTYTVTVTDANSCTASVSTTITQPAGISPSTTQVNILCFGGNNGSIDLTVTGGSTPYSYNWSNAATTQDISGLTAGTYTVTITDASGCSMTRNTTITQPALLNPTYTQTNVSCFGGSNGAVNLSVAGGVSPYSYIWSTGATTQDISGLLPATYSVTVTDANSCTATRSITITQPAAPLSSSLTQVNVTCFGGSNGSVDLTPAGGTTPYSYSWSTGATTQDISGRPIGTYNVTITDNRGCTTTNSATLTQPTAINPTTTQVNVSCNGGNNGSIDLSVTDGTPPYTYAWSTGATTQDISGRAAGNYTVTVTDAVGCTVSRLTTITQPAALTLNSTQVNVSCFAGSDASINLSVSGGTAPYTYMWTTGATTEDISGLATGTYTVTVTDANACTATRTRTITQPAAALSTTETHVDVSCFGGSNGSINLSVAGGTSPYTYLWTSGATTQDISGRTAGDYTVTVTDANSCTTTRTVTITQPATPVSTSETHVNVTCFGGSDGSVDLSVSGGVSPYTYAWSTGASTQDISGRSAGNYTATVTDANGCTTTRTTTITQPANITLSITPTSPTWYGGTNGSADLTPAGGTPGYTYAWSTGVTTQDLTNMPAGNYTVTTTDSRGCTRTGSVVIANSSQAQPYCEAFTYTNGTTSSSLWTRNVTACNLGDGGYFEVRSNQFAGNDLDGQAVWTSSLMDITGMVGVQASVDLYESGIQSGTDYIRIYYRLNGGAETLFTTNGNRTGEFTSAVATQSGLSGSTLQIVIRVYNDNIAKTHTFDNVCVTGSMMFGVTATVSNDTCIGGRVGAIDIMVDNVTGTPPFTYNWSNGATTQDISSLAAGTYSVTVRDALSNIVTRSVTVSEVNKFCAGALTCRTIYYIIQATGTSAAPDVYYIDNEDATFTLVPINTTQTALFNGIGYNHKDGFMYGVDHSGSNSGEIWKIDSTGASISVGRPAGISGDEFYSATVFEDGTLVTFSGTTDRLYRINISSTPPVIKNSRLLTGMDFIDIAVNPRDGKVYGYDRTAERFFWMDTTLASVNYFGTTYSGTSYSPGSAFFDPLGNMYIYSSNSGGGSQIYVYKVDVGLNGSGTAALTQVGTGPAVTFSDGCSCPFGFFMHKLVEPSSAMAGDTVEYAYVLGNMSLFDATLDLVDTMDDARRYIAGSLDNPFSGTVNGYGGTNFLHIDNMGVPSKTIDTVRVKVVLPLAALGSVIYNQAMVTGLPDGYEDTIRSDYPFTDELPDETPLTIVNRPPTVVNDTVTTCRNTPIDINVLANDIDYDGGLVATSVTILTTPANGTVTGGTTTSNPYCEQFNYSNGTTTSSSWTRNVSGVNLGDGGHFQVQSNRWSANDLDGEAVWTSSSVNISSFSSVSVSVDLASSNNLESDDYIRVYYRLNGGSETPLTNGLISNDFITATATANSLTGNTLQIVIRVNNDSGSEYHYFDNVCITGVTSSGTPGVLRYTPNSGFSGVNTFTYRVCDSGSPLPSECRTATVRVTVSSAVAISLTSLSDASCTGGAINISVSGGTAPYTYNWSNGITTQDLTGLPSGAYGVTVTDATGCSSTSSYNITLSSAMTTSAIPTNITCNGANNGTIDLTVNGGRTPYVYTWSNGAVTQDVSSLAVGTYSVTVRDANNCTITASASITQPAALSASTTGVNIPCNGGATGSIDLTVSGGTSPYAFNWGGGVTIEDRTALTAGSYTVTVTDNSGCTTTASRIITQPAALAPSATQVNVSCNGGSNGSIDLSVTGGTGAYAYLWSTGATTQDVNSLAIGTYTVTITDANSCTATLSRTITQPAVLSASSTQVNVTCNGGSNGSVDLTVSGGSSPYTYNWSNGSTTQDLAAVAAGNYTVTVTDAQSCTVTYSADVFQPTPIATSASTVDVACNGAATGSIDLTVSGATAPYSYLWNNGATTQDLSGRTAGTYTVTVTDAAGCTASRAVIITQSTALSASTTKADVVCNGAATGSIDLTVSGGTTPYTYSWTGGVTTEDRDLLTAGGYTVTITDAQGCTITQSATITQPAALSVSSTHVNVSCEGGNNGSVDVAVSGGTAPYTYIWSHGATSQDLSGLAVGVYTVTVTDAQSCTATTGATVTQPTALSVGIATVDVNCSGASTGSVDLTASGGTMPYSYLWSNGATTQDISSVGAGVYNVTVTDANSCTISANAILSQPVALSANSVKSDLTCNGDSIGYIFLTVSGGIEPYSYAWSNGENTQDITDLDAGTYTATITDDNGCTVAHSTTITEPAVVAASHAATHVTCYSGDNGAIDLTVTGGLPPFLYLWSNGATTEDISGLTAGTYSVTVVNTFGSCDFYYSATINEPASFSASVTKTDVSCNGGSNGTIDLSVSGGAAPYTYLWSNGATTQDVSGLTAGVFHVTITDAASCTATASASIGQPIAGLATSITQVNVSCNGGNNGSIVLNVSGGTNPYTFLWSNGAVTQNINTLTIGTYNVTVTDNNGCTASDGATISQPVALSASAVKSDVTCNGDDNGSVNLTVSGGVSPYTYVWSNGETVEDISDLTIGTYNVTVTDARSCTVSASATIGEPTVIVAAAASTNVSCHGGNNGSADITVSGGTAPYTYIWSNGAATQDISGLVIGTYNVTITDAQSCTASASATIGEPTVLAASVTKTDVTCNGGSNGAIELTVSGGTTAYTYLWSTGAVTQNISGLTAGTYHVTVTDAESCTATASATIVQPAALSLSTTKVDAACNGGSNGSIDLTVSGGLNPYAYLWSTGAITEDISGLTLGTYHVTVTNAQGCTATTSAVISQPSTITASTTKIDASCNGGTNGSIDLTVNGGTTPYAYLWSTGAATQDISGLIAGSYSVTITDAQNCNLIVSETVAQPTPLALSSTNTDVSCNGGSNGSVNLSVSGGTAAYSYLWSNGAVTQDISALSVGTFNVTVTDAQSCTATHSAIIAQPSIIIANTAETDVSCSGGNDGAVELTVSGGTAPYTYFWSNTASTKDLSGLTVGTYHVTITDAQSCTATASAVIAQPAVLQLSAVMQQPLCYGCADGSIDLTVTGGTMAYNFLWSNGATSEDLTNIPSGNYCVTVTDANNCPDNLCLNLLQPDSISVSIAITPVSCNGGNNGGAQPSVSGGISPYTYAWSTGATTQNLTGVAAGTYTLTVTDANGITKVAQATIGQPAALSASHTQSNVSCNGGSNGSIDLSVSGGTPPYTYVWSTGAVTQDVSALAIGTFTVTITDANSCSVTHNATITQPDVLAASTTKVDVTCNSLSNGSVDLTVSGGTAPYTYNWSNGAATEDLSGLTVGNYHVTVIDAQGCVITSSAHVTEPAVLAASSATVAASCNGGSDGSVDVTVTGGTTPYTYIWTTGAATQDLSGLAAGTYGATITDAQGCVTSLLAVVSEASPMNVTLAAQTNVSCNGGSNGALNISVSGGTPPYSYLWSNGAATQDVSGLAVGSFTVTVTDANSCNSLGSYTITQPTQVAASSVATDVTCNTFNNGAIDLSVSGGVMPYSYSWSNGATTQDAASLVAGNYTVTITDNNGCTITHNGVVAQPAALSISETHTNLVCNAGATGAIDITVSGGTTAYTYLWSTGATTEDVSGLAVGSYTVTVTDANSCTATRTITLSQPTSLAISSTTAPAMCDVPNGKAFITVSGGTPGYTYLWSNGATVDSITNLPGGVYQVTVSDANGCQQTAMIGVNAFPSAHVSVAKTDVTCHGGNNGSATATVTSGTPPFTYLWIPSGGTNITATALSAGTYTVQVFDSVGCTVSESVTVDEPADFAIVVAVDEPSCSGGGDGSISLTVSGSTAPYTFVWSNGATTEDVTGLTNGSYSVTITDAQSCTTSVSAAISQPTALAASTVKTDASCNGGNDGEINLSVSGGTTPYTYLWSNGATTQDVAGLTAATYTATITDAQGCNTVASATVGEPAMLSVSFIQQDALCNGNANGTINISVSGGTAPYTYTWSTGAGTEDVSGLVAAGYTVTVTDAQSCTVSQNITITEPAVLAASLTKVDVTCFGGANGSVDLTVSGGTAPYTYAWSNGAVTEDINGLNVGNYLVTVTDAQSCTVVQGIVVTQPLILNASISKTDASCNGAANGAADLTVSGGVAPYTYIWSHGATTQDISGLNIGIYNVTVTDVQGCVITASAVIAQPGVLAATTTQINVSCNGGADGSIDLTASNGTPPYIYTWSTGATTQDISGLTVGTYHVTVTDAQSCTIAVSATIAEPAILDGTTTKIDVSCNGGNNGNIDLTVSGGTTPYAYLWSNGATTQDISGLIAASYTVTITDAKGCIETESETIGQPLVLAASLVKTDVGCSSGNDGSIDLTVSGGTAPYTYLWSNGAITEDMNGLTIGNYSVTVTDALLCSATAAVTVNQPALLDASLAKTDVRCNAGNDGAVNLEVSGGTAPYTYAWSTGDTTEDLTNLVIGSYNVTVTDANGCTDDAGVLIAEPAPLTPSLAKTDVLCNGANNGFIDLSVTGGVASYAYLWSNGATSQDISGLGTGNYTVTVTDVQNCTATVSENITEPAVLAASLTKADVTCNGANNGTVDLTVSGGTTPYTYNWSNGATTEDLSGVGQNNYRVTVTDAQACTVSVTTTINQPDALVVTFVTTNASCNGSKNGAINTTVTGGTLPYNFIWSTGATTEDLSGVGAATYGFTVTDAQNCVAASSASVSEASAINVALVSVTPVSCNGGNNGAINISVSGGAPPYTYLWSNGASTQDINVVPSGSYGVTVTDASGCTGIRSFTITQPAALTVDLTSVTPIPCNGGNSGAINIIVSGGTAPYSYVWSNGATTEDAGALATGSYTVTVTDAQSCTATRNVSLTQPAALALSFSVTNPGCNGGSNGSINLTVNGGTSPYTYIWGNGATTQDISGLVAGIYTVTVSDANGCSAVNGATVNQPAQIAITYVKTDVLCNGGNNGAIDITISGGTAPYRYSWSTGATTQDISGIVAGAYSVTVSDANNCRANISVLVEQPAALSATLTQQNVTCNGGSNGSVNLTVSGGVAPYAYLWSNGATTQDLNNIVAGAYTVTVTDANNCSASAGATIAEPSAITVSGSTQNALCNAGNSGSITLVVSGGTPGYTYLWSNGETTKDITGLSSGSFSVTVTDANSCVETRSYTISEPASLVISVTGISDATCNGAANGTITISASGGTPPYAYIWSNNATTPSVNGLAAGSYSVTVTDANNCVRSANYNIGQPPVLTISSTSISNALCHGSPTGSIVISVSGGTPGYTYLWSTGATTKDISGLLAGSYTVTVTDAQNCTAVSGYAIGEPTDLAVTIAVAQDAKCYGAANGSIDVSVNGGTPPYSYTWSHGPTTQDVTGLAAGNYTVTVTDANNCAKTASHTINQPPQLAIAVDEITSALCFGQSSGNIYISVSGGTAPYIFLWSNGATSEDLLNVNAGSYTVTVTDAQFCSKTATYAIGQPTAAVSISVTGISDAKCFGEASGYINITANGGTPPYTYLWSNGATTQNATGLIANSYRVTVTDSKGCVRTGNYNIGQPADLVVTMVNVNDAACFGQSSGDINIDVNGGTPAYSYLWSNGATTQDINDVPADSYTVTVTDANTCVKTHTYSIAQPADIGIIPDSTANVLCNGGNNGSIYISVIGGTPGYTYLWSNGITTEDVTGLVAGAYTVTITDANNCTKHGSFNITQPDAISIAVTAINDAACKGAASGAIDLTVSGGVPAYTFNWAHGDSTEDITALVAGGYQVTITDANGCVETRNYNIGEPDAIAVNAVSITNNLCYGDSTGAIEIVTNGGTPPYTFNWSSGVTVQNITSAIAGVYAVTVTDAQGCLGEETYEVRQPDNLLVNITEVVNAKCNGGADGEIRVFVSGGTVPYAYKWSNGDTTANIGNLAAGAYVLTVTDRNLCADQDSADVREATSLAIQVREVIAPTCNGDSDGSIDITVSGGNPPYVFTWSTGDTTEDVSGLKAGNYTVSVTDLNVCAAMKTITVEQPDALTTANSLIIEASCYEMEDGRIELSISGGTAPYTYLWSTGSTESTLDDIAGGHYSVTVTDLKGCFRDASFAIEAPGCNRPPMAVDDTVNVTTGNESDIPVMNNDSDPDGDNITVTDIIDEPSNGVVTVNSDGTVTYMPLQGFTGEDSFTYVICDDGEPESLCDTAVVYLTIKPDRPELFIPNAISPNQDDSNEFWEIKGIHLYPDNEVLIFNRWGNEVYRMNGYKNQWNGVNQDREPLPDGTYYYILKLNDKDRSTYTGYVIIFRG